MIRIGTVFAERYGIIEKIGSGGMADVYRVKDLKTQEIVAIKALKQKFSKNSDYISRFKDEGDALSEIDSPYVVRVFDVGEDDGTYYIVMEFVDGITLKEYIGRKARLSSKETIAIAAQISVGLRSAHAHHIIHRDVKPANVILTREGKIKLTDFGIAELSSPGEKTFRDGTLGSVHYISPEQVKGREADERSDIYSLGICMYEMITGQVPFEKETAVAVALAHMNETMIPPSDLNPDCPISLEQIIFRCTQKSREKRYRSCTELLNDLKIALDEPDYNFEKKEQEKLMRSNTHVFSRKETNELRRENAEKEAVRTAAKKEERTGFDRALSVIATILGLTALGLLLYIILSFSGCISGISIGPGGRSADSGDDITLVTKDPDEFNPETDAIVPDLIGKNLQEAIAALKDAKLEFQLSYQQEYSDQYPVGSIIRQSYAGGTVVEKGSTIVLVLNSGKGYFEFEKNYVGRSIVDFRNDIAPYKSYITIEENPVFSRTVASNVIISISPSSGIVEAGKKIVVTYSTGKPYASVPDLLGKTLDEAENALKEAGLLIGDYEYAYSDTVEKGLICYQQYKKGAYIREGTKVNLRISSGKEALIVPNLSEEAATVSEAVQLLKDSGFVPVQVNWYVEGEALGMMKGQYPAAGSKLEAGGTVYVFVSSSSKEVVLPDVVGKKLSDVRGLLIGKPFKFRLRLEGIPAESEEEDGTITLVRPQNESKPLTSEDEIIVTYKTLDFSRVTMPDLTGKTLTEALQILEGKGWDTSNTALVIISYETTEDASLDDRIKSQYPETNVQTTTLSPVTLTVYSYDEEPSGSEPTTESGESTVSDPTGSTESTGHSESEPVGSSESEP